MPQVWIAIIWAKQSHLSVNVLIALPHSVGPGIYSFKLLFNLNISYAGTCLSKHIIQENTLMFLVNYLFHLLSYLHVLLNG